ncbi:uncharacterized protein LOC121255265 [Juglans microcarpa x Juglans regia]|uniref:uncharacterized protein LOC121255265 n=1 Tax=Juglans microcarpa x Juglans regia TaxID=2249226 RepID=UPI001B7DF58F|nr:uncharacterized protein LOC121255265 [Juglans microcarpa x Juglans regia]
MGPSCNNAAVFSSRVSWVVKVHAEIRHASWSAIDDKKKHELINRVRVGSYKIYPYFELYSLQNFIFYCDKPYVIQILVLQADFVLDWTKENHREPVVMALVDKYNAYHYELHKHYLKYASHEEALSGGMSLVEKPVWEWLCERWASSPFKGYTRMHVGSCFQQGFQHGEKQPDGRTLCRTRWRDLATTNKSEKYNWIGICDFISRLGLLLSFPHLPTPYASTNPQMPPTPFVFSMDPQPLPLSRSMVKSDVGLLIV